MTTLAESQKSGNLAKFVQEHEADEPGDEARFNATLASMAGTSKEVPATSGQVPSDD